MTRWMPPLGSGGRVAVARRSDKLVLRILTRAQPTGVEAGNVEWLDFAKQDGAEGDEDAFRKWKREKEEEEKGKAEQPPQASSGGAEEGSVLNLTSQSESDQKRREKEFASILQVNAFFFLPVTEFAP